MANLKKPRRYTKRSPHWKEKPGKTNSLTKPVIGTTKLDNYITELETMTGHKFTPSEVVHIASGSKY